MTTLKKRIKSILKGSDRGLSVKEVYDIHEDKFPHEVLEKISKYDTVALGKKQLKAEIGSVLCTHFKYKKLYYYAE